MKLAAHYQRRRVSGQGGSGRNLSFAAGFVLLILLGSSTPYASMIICTLCKRVVLPMADGRCPSCLNALPAESEPEARGTPEFGSKTSRNQQPPPIPSQLPGGPVSNRINREVCVNPARTSQSHTPPLGTAQMPHYHLSTDEYNSTVYCFSSLKWPFVIPRRCVYCGRQTQNSRAFSFSWRFGLFLNSGTITSTIHLPTCLPPQIADPISEHQQHHNPPCKHVDTSQRSYYVNFSGNQTEAHIWIYNRDWAEAFAIANDRNQFTIWANGTHSLFAYQEIVYYLQGKREELPSANSVAAIRNPIDGLEAVFVACTNIKGPAKKELPNKLRNIGLSFSSQELADFQRRGMRKIKSWRLATFICGPFAILGIMFGVVFSLNPDSGIAQ